MLKDTTYLNDVAKKASEKEFQLYRLLYFVDKRGQRNFSLIANAIDVIVRFFIERAR